MIVDADFDKVVKYAQFCPKNTYVLRSAKNTRIFSLKYVRFKAIKLQHKLKCVVVKYGKNTAVFLSYFALLGSIFGLKT